MGSEITVERNNQEIQLLIPDTFYKNYSKSKQLFIEPDNFKFKIDSVFPESNALKGGLLKGDHIVLVDSNPIGSFGDFKSLTKSLAGKQMAITVLRDNDSVDLLVDVDSNGMIGFAVSEPPYQKSEYSIAQGFKYGWKDGISILTANIKGIGRIFSGEVKATESLQGPIGIANIYGGVWIWPKFWYLTGLISFILAFMTYYPFRHWMVAM